MTPKFTSTKRPYKGMPWVWLRHTLIRLAIGRLTVIANATWIKGTLTIPPGQKGALIYNTTFYGKKGETDE